MDFPTFFSLPLDMIYCYIGIIAFHIESYNLCFTAT